MSVFLQKLLFIIVVYIVYYTGIFYIIKPDIFQDTYYLTYLIMLYTGGIIDTIIRPIEEEKKGQGNFEKYLIILFLLNPFVLIGAVVEVEYYGWRNDILLVLLTHVSYFLSLLIIAFGKSFPGISTLFSFPENINTPYPYNLLCFMIIFLGLILVAWANYTLLVIGKIGLKAREPFHIPSKLVFEGPYKHSRNPIYLAVVIMLVGLAIVTTSLLLTILTLVLFFLFHIKFIGWEEKNLEEVFGDEYLDYKKRVRRWI
ncbi:MAG: hypothetical protein HeimC2_27760 [Candidatus Heimdallarchaeota archaeon LC_2]|nr:MAG: hypothetical protein HeimC2_27760 [Candidatus Heimdallarchaeota archaeon LC_2]